jgi:F-type H+-transporting ATPase subunit delta
VIEGRIVRRYATALFNAARNAGAIDRIESDLGLVSYTLESMPSFMEAMRSPVVARDTKKRILREVFADKIHEVTLSFLDLLAEKRREEVALYTEPVYIELADEARGIVKIDVTAAVPLTKDEETALAKKLSATTGRIAQLSVTVDPEIIGGLMVRVGDTVIDGSVRGQLEALREKLMA